MFQCRNCQLETAMLPFRRRREAETRLRAVVNFRRSENVAASLHQVRLTLSECVRSEAPFDDALSVFKTM